MAIQYEMMFSNAQDVKADNATVLCTNTIEQNAANSHKLSWWVISRNNTTHGTQAEIGGMTWVSIVSLTVAGGNLTVSLKTAATNNLNATGTTIASVVINNGTAAGTKYAVRLPAGTKRLKYLGAISTAAGNVTAANLTTFLTTGAGAETPSK